MRVRSSVAGLALALVTVSSRLDAQAFQAGTNYIGPSISLATYGSTVAFAGNFEHAINDKWGWGISVGYFSYSQNFGCFEGFCDNFSYTVIPVSGTAAYHFKVESNPKLDPFVGGAAGVFLWHCSVDGGACGDGAHTSGLLIGGFGGVRYWIKDNLALTARAGYGIGFLTAGVDFKM